jgi:hypothetical protein
LVGVDEDGYFCSIDIGDGQPARDKLPKKVLSAQDSPRTSLGKVRTTGLSGQYIEADQ